LRYLALAGCRLLAYFSQLCPHHVGDAFHWHDCICTGTIVPVYFKIGPKTWSQDHACSEETRPQTIQRITPFDDLKTLHTLSSFASPPSHGLHHCSDRLSYFLKLLTVTSTGAADRVRHTAHEEQYRCRAASTRGCVQLRSIRAEFRSRCRMVSEGWYVLGDANFFSGSLTAVMRPAQQSSACYGCLLFRYFCFDCISRSVHVRYDASH
jgi:hypothetical protein